ncbi:MAG: MarR family winged helix-turn-helix transcriptional regulator [Phocaeicola sp.]
MKRLCKIRDIQRSIMQFEQEFIACYGICLNEGMALCSICQSEEKKLTSSEIGELLGLTLSNTSKVLAAVEKKGLLKRTLGKTDKRQMFFSLTPKGAELLAAIKCKDLAIPASLDPLFCQ